MNRRMLTIISVVVLCAVALCMSLTGRKVSAQSASVYNPYPPGILPSNLSSEIARVLAEVDFIEARAIARWQALTPPTLTGQPPILQNTGTEAVEALGELMNYDRRISPERNQACASCHMPYVAFSGPIPSVNLTMIAYPGTAHFRAGKRSAQRYPYAPFFPVLQYNQEQGLFFGGNFWDSRATGYLLRNPDAHQAQGPPVDTQEMGNPDTACITFKLSKAVYRPLFELVWGKGSFDISFPANTADICATPGGAAVFGGSATPVQLSAVDRIRSNEVYNHWGQSIDAYEQSLQVSAFSSKFAAVRKGKNTPDSFGFTANPLGFGYRDLGLGTFLRSGPGSWPNPNITWRKFAPTVDGQMQVSSARNVAMTPPQCPTTEAPGPYFQKEFFHNGYIKSLKQLVHFYNTRDVYPFDVTSGHCPAGTTEKVDCWPMPEVKNNLDMTTGKLGLTDLEENQIVAFLRTLTDGFTRPYPNRDTFTGACMTGGSAKTQGNGFLIPTPPLPPCASAVCGVPPVPNPPIP